MTSENFVLRRATAADIPFIMATERLEGYEKLVGRWEADAHAAAFADAAYRYFIGEIADRPIGFALLRDWATPARVTCIKRLAVAEPGQGRGSLILRHAIDAVFEQTDTHRLWIGAFPENLRARKAYRNAGFEEEGVARGSAYFGGVFRDETILSILRPEWNARRAGGGL
ncbi:GNAT family protein [Mesorhizobium sp. LHD-90]|uniref:GNAT family N-acetyltransferase n=1 Tax=Mesorhizobium sp. LHD-90 TaxID=3071414 RepID=UPI0027E0A3CA|nr:GNAT family protein [Mesorhizobium sp. LHD-90]MDQ6435216.1 GNAT family protein [Mesorhizobium sp. LHD-90]